MEVVECVEVRLHGELERFVRPARRGAAFARRMPPPLPTVKDVLEGAGVPHTELGRVLVNGRPAGLGDRLADGDRIDAHPRSARSGGVPQFVVDVHLGALARHLRLLGFDVWWSPVAGDEELARRSSYEGRILLTRDRGLLKRRQVTGGLHVHSTDPQEQIVEVLRRLGIDEAPGPFTRCLVCGSALESVATEQVAADLPGTVADEHDTFSRCTGCGRVYWPGSHHARLARRLQQILEAVRLNHG